MYGFGTWYDVVVLVYRHFVLFNKRNQWRVGDKGGKLKKNESERTRGSDRVSGKDGEQNGKGLDNLNIEKKICMQTTGESTTTTNNKPYTPCAFYLCEMIQWLFPSYLLTLKKIILFNLRIRSFVCTFQIYIRYFILRSSFVNYTNSIRILIEYFVHLSNHS